MLTYKTTNIIIVAFIALLAIATFSLARLDNPYKTVFIGCLYLISIGLINYTKLNVNDVGLSLKNTKDGLLLALPFVVIIIIASFILYLAQPELFRDSRYNQNTQAMLITILLLIPFSTVLLEELLFRGVLFGLLKTIHTENIAVLVSSLVFGLWHLYTASAVNTTDMNTTIAVPKFVSVLAIIVITFLAGVFFSWLRIKSGSLLAPILVHWTLNSSGVFFAYLAWSR